MRKILATLASFALFCALPVRAEEVATIDDHLASGSKFVQDKNYPEAAREFRTAVRVNPQSADANLLLGLTLANTGDLEGAVRYTQASLQIKPSYSGYYNLGLILANQEKYTESAAAYEDAVKLNATSYQAWYQLGLVQATALKFDRAIEAFNKVIELNPKFASAYHGLGSSYYWNRDLEGAKAQVQRLSDLQLETQAQKLNSWIEDKEAKKARSYRS